MARRSEADKPSDATGGGNHLLDIYVLKEKRERMIVKAFEEGHALGDIARANGSTEARVRRVLRTHGVDVD